MCASVAFASFFFIISFFSMCTSIFLTGRRYGFFMFNRFVHGQNVISHERHTVQWCVFHMLRCTLIRFAYAVTKISSSTKIAYVLHFIVAKVIMTVNWFLTLQGLGWPEWNRTYGGMSYASSLAHTIIRSVCISIKTVMQLPVFTKRYFMFNITLIRLNRLADALHAFFFRLMPRWDIKCDCSYQKCINKMECGEFRIAVG